MQQSSFKFVRCWLHRNDFYSIASKIGLLAYKMASEIEDSLIICQRNEIFFQIFYSRVLIIQVEMLSRQEEDP